MNLEDELRAALRPEPAPPDFGASVLTRARTKVIPVWRRPAALAVAAALTLSLLIPPAISVYRRREAGRQLLTALAIARAQLDTAKNRIRRNTRHTL